jgi:hypothetical protein
MPGPRFTSQYSGYKQSAKWRIKKAKQMIDWEREAKERGVPIARVMAEAIAK